MRTAVLFIVLCALCVQHARTQDVDEATANAFIARAQVCFDAAGNDWCSANAET